MTENVVNKRLNIILISGKARAGKDTFADLVKQELKSDLEKRNDTDITLPFESSINKYSIIVNNIKKIEKEIKLLEDYLSNSLEIKNAKKIAATYYDTIEELLRILTISKKENSTLRDKNILKELAKDIGFIIDENTIKRTWKKDRVHSSGIMKRVKK